MNCPQCQAANGPDAGFCGSCGAQLAVAESAAPLGYGDPSAPGGYPSSGGYGPPSGAPGGYRAPDGPPGGYGAPSSAPGGYDAPSGPPSGYGGPSSAPGGYSPASGYGAPSGPPSGYGAPGEAPGGYNSAGQTPPAAPPQSAGYQPGPGQWQGQGQGQYQPPAGGGGSAPRMPANLPPVNFDASRLDRTDRIIAVATLIALISIWLPWFTVSYSGGLGSNVSGSASATTAHGAWMYLEFILAIVLLAYLAARAAWDRLPFTVPVAHPLLLIIGTGVQLLIMLIAFFDLPSVPSSLSGFSVGWAWGAFVGLLAALVAAGPVLVPAVRSYLENRRAGGSRSF